MANQAAQTAYGPISVVAIEQFNLVSQRVIQDELAIQFLPPGARWLVKLTRWRQIRNLLITLSEKNGRGVWGGVLGRKRYIDDRLLEAVNAGIQSVVILGAGLDTRPYRLSALKSLSIFEADLPENIAYKRSRLQELYGRVPPNVTLVPVDFNNQDLGCSLAAQGYKTESKGFFIMEAVTQYLTEDGIQKVFRFLAQARHGSRLVFTYVRKDFIDGVNFYGLHALYEAYRAKRHLWHFGLEPLQVSAFLGGYGWKELEQVGSQEFTTRYLKPVGREMPVMEIERIVLAEKK